MAPAFSKAEYSNRIDRVRHAMQTHDIEVLVIGDPSNMNWLTGFDSWSFYTPQLMVIDLVKGPFLMTRLMDVKAASFTTYLPESQIIGYPEPLVQQADRHPSDYVAGWMRDAGHATARIGYESDCYYFSPRSLHALQAGLPDAKWVDADLLVNWVRAIKSDAELAMMYQAAKIADLAMQTAWDGAKVGVRQCDLMADITATQIKGTAEFGGDMPALHPLILAGEAATAAHPMWTDASLEAGQTIAFELGACRKRYNVGLARTVHMGAEKPAALIDTAKAVEEGMQAVMESLRADAVAGDVHAAWQGVLDRYGLEKKSRIGYSIGVAYAPDWGEHTISFRPAEPTIVPKNAVVHIILGMWMDGWGMELSETLHVREKDCVRLSAFPQNVHVVS